MYIIRSCLLLGLISKIYNITFKSVLISQSYFFFYCSFVIICSLFLTQCVFSLYTFQHLRGIEFRAAIVLLYFCFSMLKKYLLSIKTLKNVVKKEKNICAIINYSKNNDSSMCMMFLLALTSLFHEMFSISIYG